MKARVLGLMAALVLAIVGTLLLIGYVRRAADNARADQEVVDVLVVDEAIPAGTPVSEAANRVRVDQVPPNVRAIGNLTSVERLLEQEDRVIAVDLVEGDQLVASRLVQTSTFSPQGAVGAIEVPEGLVTVTLSLSPQRALGGSIVPGDLVGVVESFEPFEIGGEEGELAEIDGVVVRADGETPNSSHFTVHGALVTNVQLEELPREQAAEEDDSGQVLVQGPPLAPTGNLLITVAVRAADAERVVFGAEYGTIWLTGETEVTDTSGTRIQTRGTVYVDIPAGVQ